MNKFTRSLTVSRLPSMLLGMAVLLLLISAMQPIEARTASLTRRYLPPGPIEDGMPAHLLLVYSGYYNANARGGLFQEEAEAIRSDGGDWLAEDFVPYVAHLNWDGEPDDTFFDSFLFLGLTSGRGRAYAGEVGQEKASLWHDWQWYIDRLFTPDKQIDALNQAVAELGPALGKPDYTVNVYIMIPYPSYLVEDFGHLDGSMGGFSLLPVENRQRVVTWFVDEVIRRWESWNPDHVNLAGFYWLQEHINPAVPGEERFVRDVVAYVQDRDYKIGWIPWSGAFLATSWRSYGFDWAIIQPNHMFRDQPNMMQIAAERGQSARMGIEIELDGSVKGSVGEQKLYDYLDAGVEYGFMREAMIGYYQDLNMLARLYYDEDGRWRFMYDDIYAFVKGTYPAPSDVSGKIAGAVQDVNGHPVVNAQVRSGSRVTTTDAGGHFTLDGLYTKQADLMILHPDYNPVVTSMPTVAQVDQPGATHVFTLDTPDVRLLHSFDHTGSLLRLGTTWQQASEPKTEGDASLQVTVQSGTMASLQVRPDRADQDWQDNAVVALDVFIPDRENVKLQVTLRDQDSETYTRSYVIEPNTWQTIAIPLAEATEGHFHEPLVPGSLGRIDVSRITMLSISLAGAETGTQVYLDNLRLIGTSSAR